MSDSAPVPQVRLAEVRAGAVSGDEVLALVADDQAGGHCVFVGTVRNHDDEHEVVALEYSAHPQAEVQLAEVAREVIAEFDVLAAAVVHRVGALKIGEATVALAVSAAHRDQAFAASRALIDRLKQRVPIWKHQIYADGTSSWVNCP